ncbi:MAG: hypothetical protein K9L30_18715 [Desulfobacterales bacterium]|nr:hypothetical protein [Desulfobacterales bacterium]
MVRVKTFTNVLKPLYVMKALRELDDQVNAFIRDNHVEKVVSVSDTSTSGDGETIGIIRVLAYKTT